MTVEKLIARVGADITGFEAGMGKVVSGAKKAALAVMGIATAAAVVGSKFEFELTKTASVAQAFGKDLEALEKKARKLGATTAFTATQAARGMYDLASAGMTTNQILAATEHAMKLAGATGSEMHQATNLLASSLKQFGLEAEESKRVVDTYAAAITGSMLTMEKLTEAMKFAGTTGASFGWTIEETTAAVAQFTNLGLEGTMAGTNLRMSMLDLVKATSKGTKALKEMGLTYEDVNPEMHDFGEILRILSERSMTTEQATAIFTKRSAMNMKRLADAVREGKMDFDELRDSLHKAQEGAGRANEMYERLMATFKGEWKIVLSAAEELLLNIFDTMKEDGVSTLKLIKEKFDDLSSWVKENSEDMKTFWADVAGWIEVAAEMAGGLASAMGAIAKVMASASREQLISPEGIGLRMGPRVHKIREKIELPEGADRPIPTGREDQLKYLREITKEVKETAQKRADAENKAAEVAKKAAEVEKLARIESIEAIALADAKAKEELQQAQRTHYLAMLKFREEEKNEVLEHNKKLLEDDKTKWKTRLELASTMVGKMGQTMDMLYSSGLVRSKKMFAVMKAFKITEAIINTSAAVMQALSSWPPPISWALAAVTAAMGAVQVAVIAKSKPPGYAEGGIVRGLGDGRGQTIRVGERGDEAVVPLRGGNIPVRMTGRGSEDSKVTTVENHQHYHMENATFMDQNTLANAIKTLAVAGVREDFDNDGSMRRVLRRG